MADPLQRISCSSRRYIATSASQGGERRNGKGGTTSGGESQSIPRRATEGTSREQGGKEKEEKYTREKGMRSRREPEREVGTREEERRLRRRGKRTRGRVRLFVEVVLNLAQVSGSRGLRAPGYLRAPRAPLARGKFDLLATLFTGCRC